jgi:hypothetical protein
MTSRIEAHPKHHPPSLSDLRASAAKVRLRAGVQYLHWSGGFLTDNPEHAWSGTPDQARACRLKFNAAAGCKMVEA